MGLHEKRALAAAQKDKFPGWVKDIQDAAGKELAFEVAWPELCKDGYADSFAAGLAYNFFVPLRQAFERICIDDIGRDAVRSSITGVKLTSQRSWCSLEVKFEGGVVHLDADPSYNRDDSCIEDNTARILAELEPKL